MAKKNRVVQIKTAGQVEDLPTRARSKFLVQHVLPSDNHTFIGRIYDLSIVVYHFDSYEELAKHADCKYAFEVNESLSILTRRVESLNLVGGLLWPQPMPKDFGEFPFSRYEWLVISADVFLMRYVSVVDCALLLANSVYELGIESKKCTLKNLKKKGLPLKICGILLSILKDQGELRAERNRRIHHGLERGFTQDDLTFRSAALYEHRSGGVGGKDRFGRRINMEKFFKEGLVELQREFNGSTRRLIRFLDSFYDYLGIEFETRFIPRIRASTHGFNSRRYP